MIWVWVVERSGLVALKSAAPDAAVFPEKVQRSKVSEPLVRTAPPVPEFAAKEFPPPFAKVKQRKVATPPLTERSRWFTSPASVTTRPAGRALASTVTPSMSWMVSWLSRTRDWPLRFAAKVIVSAPGVAAARASDSRSEPGPESAEFVTTRGAAGCALVWLPKSRNEEKTGHNGPGEIFIDFEVEGKPHVGSGSISGVDSEDSSN